MTFSFFFELAIDIPYTDMINRSNFVATTIWELNEYGE